LTTVEAGHGFDDMMPIARIVGDARVVALGETTHGTREFFQLKHRMIEFLTTQIGFTIFTIEALPGVLLGRSASLHALRQRVPAFVRALRRYCTTVRLPINAHVGLLDQASAPASAWSENNAALRRLRPRQP
jgi:hypothetical protein